MHTQFHVLFLKKTSKISFIDGDKGILQYRGIPIEQLAEMSTFTEVAYLLLNGDLPTSEQLKHFKSDISQNTAIHPDLIRIIKSFPTDAHPMGMLAACISALSTVHPEANPALQGNKVYDSEDFVNKQIYRILGNIPTIAAYCYSHKTQKPFIEPRTDLWYEDNFLFLLDNFKETVYKSKQDLGQILNTLAW